MSDDTQAASNTATQNTATQNTAVSTERPARSVVLQITRILLLGTLIGVVIFTIYVGIALLGY